MARLLSVSLIIILLALAAGAPPGPAYGPIAHGLSGVALEAADLVTEPPRNVIFFLGDGMGAEHVRAASLYAGRPMVFEEFPFTSSMTTDSASGLTDSAAAATALATGQRVSNKVISMALPGNGEELMSVMDLWQAQGAAVGLVTTAAVNDASPAAFGAHEPTRDNKAEIALDYFEQSRPNILMGGIGEGMSETLAALHGYTVVLDADEMFALDMLVETHVAGLFGDEHMRPINHGREPHPSLAQMTTAALDMLEEDPDGFFLLVEQEGTDSFSHSNRLDLMVDALLELEEAVQAALDWAGEDGGDTLIVVTADHETGGLQVRTDNGPGVLPEANWTAGSRHTDLHVPIYGIGPSAELVALITDIPQVASVLEPGGEGPPPPTGTPPTPTPIATQEYNILLPLAKWFHAR